MCSSGGRPIYLWNSSEAALARPLSLEGAEADSKPQRLHAGPSSLLHKDSRLKGVALAGARPHAWQMPMRCTPITTEGREWYLASEEGKPGERGACKQQQGHMGSAGWL